MSEEHQKRYFELKDEKSAKFWEVSLEGVTVGVRYGKIGATGQIQSKSFGDAAAARSHADKLVAEKTGKGYVESGRVALPESTTAADSQARAPALPAKKAAGRKPALLPPTKDREASPEALRRLLGQDDATNRLLAAHPKADAQLLEKLSHSSDTATRRSVAKNPNTPQPAYVRLGQQFPKEFLANPMLDLLLLENPALMEQVPEALLVRLLKQADCPASLLTWASAHPRAKVQLAVAMNPGAGQAAKERLHDSQHAAVRDAVQHAEVDVGLDPERAFELAVKERLGSMARSELEEAWQAGDIGLAQWSALPLTFRLHRAAGGFWYGQSEAVSRLISDLRWSLAEVRALLPGFEWWVDVARSPNLTAVVLEVLAKDNAVDVRRAVAENPKSPGTVLSTLAKDSDWLVRSKVARNTNTPGPAIGVCAKDRDGNVRAAVVRNPNAPAPTLEKLIKDRSVQVRQAWAQSAHSSLSTFQALSTDANESVRIALAENPTCPAHTLEKLIQDRSARVQRAVAKNPACPAPVLEAICQIGGRAVHVYLARNPATPVKVLDMLSKEAAGPIIQAQIARHPTLPEENRRALLETLGKSYEALGESNSWTDRREAAKNLATPAGALETLSRDGKAEVRCAVASNPHCPVEVLKRLASDDSSVQEGVARNASTPLETLIQLADSKFPQVRETLAIHAHRSDELRRKLWSDPADDVRRLTASCPGLSAAMLDELLQGCQVESDLLALFVNPNLGHASAQVIAEKVFTTPAAQSLWFLREVAKATADVQAAAVAGAVLACFTKDPNEKLLAKRPLAAIMALCSGPYIEVARIVKVSGSTDWLVRAAVARNPGTPPNLLKKLASDVHPLVSALAGLHLSKLGTAKAIGNAISNKSATLNLDRAVGEILRRLRGEGARWAATPMLNSAAWRDRANLDEVVSWLKRFEEFDGSVQSLLAELDETQRDQFWTWAASAKDVEVRMRLVQHPAAPLAALERFSTDQSAEVLIAVAGNAKLPKAFRSKVEKAALRAIMSRGVSFRWKIALHAAAAHPFIKERLLKEDKYRLRQLLATTSSYPDWMTRDRWSTSDEGISEVTQAADAVPREESARLDVRKRLTLERMARLRQAFHLEVLVRKDEPSASAVPLTAMDMLSALAWLDCVPASDKAAPTKSSRSPDWLSRFGAALHPGASDAILTLLRQDADPDVAAAARLRTSSHAAMRPTD